MVSDLGADSRILIYLVNEGTVGNICNDLVDLDGGKKDGRMKVGE